MKALLILLATGLVFFFELAWTVFVIVLAIYVAKVIL